MLRFTLLAVLLTPPFGAASPWDTTGPLSDSQAASSTEFVVHDIIVSDPVESLTDPEFDKNLDSLHMAWTDRDGNLWVNDVDLHRGTWSPKNGRQTLVDTGLIGIASTRQGPEWVYARNENRILYTTTIEDGLQLFQAARENSGEFYHVGPLAEGFDKSVAKAGQPNDIHC